VICGMDIVKRASWQKYNEWEAVSKIAKTAHPILPVIAERWSPRAFDPARELAPAELMQLFEAARWAASADNAQPWRFVYAFRDKPGFAEILNCLKPTNMIWARNACVLMVAIAQLLRDNNEPNRHALHDVGQALAALMLQATSMGLGGHQMAGFDPSKARATLSIPVQFEPITAVAVGWPGDPAGLPDHLRQRELASRQRKPIEAFAFDARWQQEG
jgi:nitroreductase